MSTRREFITLLGGAAATWPLAARGQQGERVRRIGVLINMAADDPEGHARITAFAQGLQEAGWTTGRNVRIDYRWGGAVRGWRRPGTMYKPSILGGPSLLGKMVHFRTDQMRARTGEYNVCIAKV